MTACVGYPDPVVQESSPATSACAEAAAASPEATQAAPAPKTRDQALWRAGPVADMTASQHDACGWAGTKSP